MPPFRVGLYIRVIAVVESARLSYHLEQMAGLMAMFSGDDQLQWLAALNAIRYDVVRGNLAVLRGSGGDFTVATDGCIAENLGATALSHTGDNPPSGSGFWYLVRGVATAGNLTYDAPGNSQVGLRDAEIDASPVSCN